MTKFLCGVLIIVVLSEGCQSIARIDDFSPSAKIYDFNKISSSRLDGKGSKAQSEYYIKTNVTGEALIVFSIINSLEEAGFYIKTSNFDDKAILAERGMRANEWNSVAGVYYQYNPDGYEIYIICKITQDFTGGWREDRAQKIGTTICSHLNKCVQSYSVDILTQK